MASSLGSLLQGAARLFVSGCGSAGGGAELGSWGEGGSAATPHSCIFVLTTVEGYFHVQTGVHAELSQAHGRQAGGKWPFRTEMATWVLSRQPLASTMECNKLCDEHTIAGSLSNLAEGRAARMWGSQVSSRAHHPSILFLF